MSIELGLNLIALLLAMWAIHWARSAANAAERAASAAEKTALEVGRTALAARRAAEAAEASALAASTPAQRLQPLPSGNAEAAPALNVDALVKESVANWDQEHSLWPLISRHPGLTETEVETMVHRVFYALGRSDGEARQHAQAVLNLRRGQAL